MAEDTAILKRVRSLVADLREVGDIPTADLVEATLAVKPSEVDAKRVWQYHQTASGTTLL